MAENVRSAASTATPAVYAPRRSSLGRKLLIAFGVLVVALGVFAVVAAMQPAEFSVTRSATMAAPPAAVFAQINNFHNWNAWSPWAKRDPSAKYTFEGPESGDGAIMAWDGNDEVGAGQMTIVESRPSELVKLKLDFTRPMQDAATTDFTFKPAGDGTVVNWHMYGENNFVEKAFCMFMDMDKMVGGDFEKGLANIKQIVEAEPAEQQSSE